MAIDIILANSGNPIQNGSCIVTCSNVGQYPVLDTYAATTPAISDIQSKYDNRFYNGLFVNVTGSGILGV